MGSAMNRRSVVRIAAALAFVFAAPAAFAHAQLEKATPAVGGAVQEQEPRQTQDQAGAIFLMHHQKFEP